MSLTVQPDGRVSLTLTRGDMDVLMMAVGYAAATAQQWLVTDELRIKLNELLAVLMTPEGRT